MTLHFLFQATKKELGQVEALLEQGMNEYSEEQASMLRLNMAIVEERTCQWSLFQVIIFTKDSHPKKVSYKVSFAL